MNNIRLLDLTSVRMRPAFRRMSPNFTPLGTWLVTCCLQTGTHGDESYGNMDHADTARLSSLPGMGGGTVSSAAVLQAALQPPPTTSAGEAYSIDVEHAPQAIADLRRAALALSDEARKASDLATITPPGLDVVSAHAVQVFADVAAGEHGSLRLALLGAAARFLDDADKLEASLRTHLETDEISIPAARDLTWEGPR